MTCGCGRSRRSVSLWDCETITKVRAGDGVLIAGEKRLVVHFMIQPNFVPELLGDPVLRQQGFLSRLLIAWPRVPDRVPGR